MDRRDPNHGLCVDALDVLAWQVAAGWEPTAEREAAVPQSDAVLAACERCLHGFLGDGDPTKPCALAELAIKFTSLGPSYE